MIPESEAWDGRVLPERERWNALECRNVAGKRASECRKSEFFSFLYFFRFLVYSILAGGIPVKVELVEELGPVSVVRSGTADLRQNVVHR